MTIDAKADLVAETMIAVVEVEDMATRDDRREADMEAERGVRNMAPIAVMMTDHPVDTVEEAEAKSTARAAVMTIDRLVDMGEEIGVKNMVRAAVMMIGPLVGTAAAENDAKSTDRTAAMTIGHQVATVVTTGATIVPLEASEAAMNAVTSPQATAVPLMRSRGALKLNATTAVPAVEAEGPDGTMSAAMRAAVVAMAAPTTVQQAAATQATAEILAPRAASNLQALRMAAATVDLTTSLVPRSMRSRAPVIPETRICSAWLLDC
jgi:hypothetical protein